ncbi:MAG: DNA gyrase subunit A [Dehalococcoidia bacterium]|jgi:DNA gyrase subunit A
MQIGAVKQVDIREEMKTSYLDYAMSVIVARALPDVRDGLKPVQRRILYAMGEMGIHYNSAHKKSARIVGEVMGKFHPHGDAPVYEAMVRMAQDFSMRYPLIDGQGNFGSIDNDPPAAMRYTEARLARISQEMLADIDKDTVGFIQNFDGSLMEPVVLPSRIPNLLVNGAAGIAVGMATNIPPHNLGEISDALCLLIDNPEVSPDELSEIVKGPDFPTAGIIYGREGIKNAYATGKGRVIIRARHSIEELAKGRQQIVVTELPYQVNKAALVERISDLVKSKKLEGITELRDESDRNGMRVVIELRRGMEPEQVLNNLFKHTPMQTAFYLNMLALVDGQPKVIGLKTALNQYIIFRQDVIIRRTKFDLKKAQERAHILEGLKIALDNLDEVITTIRNSHSVESARKNLMEKFKLSEIQAQAILEMQLRRLAALERKKINDEYAEILKTIAYLEDLLANPRKILFLIKEDVIDVKEKYGDQRRSEIIAEELGHLSEEDLVHHQKVAIVLTTRGYIKRMPLETYRVQQRGGRGVAGISIREEETVRRLLVADTLDTLLFFTNLGRVYSLKCYKVPQETSRIAKGTPLVKLISISEEERVTEVLPVTEFIPGYFLLMMASKGVIKRTALENFASVRSNGIIAMKLPKGDQLISARIAKNEDEVIIISEKAQAIRFAVSELRIASRTSGGVRGMRLAPEDRVVQMDIILPDASVLVLTKTGQGKCSRLANYRKQSRGGSGVKTLSGKVGPVVAARVINDSDEVMIQSSQGVVIRMRGDVIPVQGRIRRGASIMKLDEGDEVMSIAALRE